MMGYAFEKGKGMPGRYIRTTAKADIYICCAARASLGGAFTQFFTSSEN
jgi:hypothetical protein